MSRPAGTLVLLTLTGIQTDPDGNRQESTSVYEAVCTKEESGYLFRYREQKDAAEFFLSRGSVWMKREGQAAIHMRFDPSGIPVQGTFRTPFGSIPLTIRTERIAILDSAGAASQKNPAVLRARIKYSLTLGGDCTQSCSMTIRVQSIEKEQRD